MLKMHLYHRHLYQQHCTMAMKISVDICTLNLKENAIYN